jgi:hypothetical protein
MLSPPQHVNIQLTVRICKSSWWPLDYFDNPLIAQQYTIASLRGVVMQWWRIFEILDGVMCIVITGLCSAIVRSNADTRTFGAQIFITSKYNFTTLIFWPTVKKGNLGRISPKSSLTAPFSGDPTLIPTLAPASAMGCEKGTSSLPVRPLASSFAHSIYKSNTAANPATAA